MSYPGSVGKPVDPEAPTPNTGPPAPLAQFLGDELTAGTMVGEFRVESRLGAGGMSTVYSAVQPLIGKRAAIKVLSANLCVDPTSVARFIQEARAVNQIGHPNIVDAFAFGTLPDGRSYSVMEWLQGETLGERVSRGPLSVGEAIAIIFQICDGLAAAHDKGVVHRDLKPENVFLVPVRKSRLLVKLLDFGIAKLRGRDGEIDVKHTQPGKTIGTPRYMSPEQALGREVDYRADVYALGVTAYEMFTGSAPFLANEAIDVMHQHVHAQPPAPSLLRPDMPVQIERLLLQMLEKRPDKRPTLMQIEARLADVRDSLLPAGRASGAARAIGGDVEAELGDSGSNKHVVLAPRIAATDSIVSLRLRERRRLVVGAIGLGVVVALVGGVLLTRHGGKHTAVIVPREMVAQPVVTPMPIAPATLLLTVNVPNASVTLDGVVLAESSPGGLFTVEKTGPLQLTVSAPKRRSFDKVVELSAGRETKVDVVLERAGAARPTATTTTTAATAATTATAATAASGAHKGKRRTRSRDDMIDPFANP